MVIPLELDHGQSGHAQRSGHDPQAGARLSRHRAPGSIVEFEVTPDGRIALVKQGASPGPSRFEKLRGTASTKLTTDQLMALLRGDD
jgi:hypothetical protein